MAGSPVECQVFNSKGYHYLELPAGGLFWYWQWPESSLSLPAPLGMLYWMVALGTNPVVTHLPQG